MKQPLLGLEEALRRARAFAAAGADILFVEAPESEAEMATICSSLADTGKPLLVNCVEGTLAKKLLVHRAWVAYYYTILISTFCNLCFYVGDTFWTYGDCRSANSAR